MVVVRVGIDGRKVDDCLWPERKGSSTNVGEYIQHAGSLVHINGNLSRSMYIILYG